MSRKYVVLSLCQHVSIYEDELMMDMCMIPVSKDKFLLRMDNKVKLN